MDKRNGLRQHFQAEASQAQSIQQHQQRTAQLNSLENTVIEAINMLVRFLDGKVTKTEVTNQLKSISTPDVDKVVAAVSKLDADVLANKVDTKPLEKIMQGIQREVSLIPKKNVELPEQREDVRVTNLDEVKLDTSEVVQAIKDLKLDPTIDVKSPIVNVDKPDLKPIQDIMLDLLKAYQNQKFPEFPTIPETDLSEVEKKLDESNKHLKELVDKPVARGGGGGGGGLPYVTPAGAAAHVTLDDSGSIPITTAHKRFRDNFAIAGTQPDSTIWSSTNSNSNHTITVGGNSSGSAYLRISLNPLVDDSEYTLTSKAAFSFPMRMGYGISISQRISGQEVFAGMLGDDGTGSAVDFTTTQVADFSLATATVTVTANVATVTLPTNTASPYTGGDRICIYGMTDSRLNVGPVVVTALTYNSFSVPAVATNGTYVSTSAFIRFADPLRYAYNGSGYLWENTTVTNASVVSRRNGSKFRSLNTAQTTTTATQSNVNPYTDAFNSAGNFEQEMRLEEMNYRSFASDSQATANDIKYTQGIPDENPSYHLHVRARNLIGMTKPVARITAIAKTGTTTATVTTDVAHGLTTSDFIQIYGVRDQAASSFPNLVAQTAVASVIDSTHFTVLIGTAATVSSAGGCVYRVQGAVLAPGAYSAAVQSITQTNGVVTVVGSTTWATPLPGEYVYLYGLDGDNTKEGAYKVLRVSTTTLELQGKVGVADFGTITTGGVAIKMTDVRVHFARTMDYSRLVAEIVGGRGNTTDINNAVPTALVGGIVTTVSTVSAITSANLALPGIIADIASAALTTTTTTAAVIPTFGSSYQVNIAVTAVTGTTPTLDVQIQESRDTGVNWVAVYDFPRITATGSYNSPLLTLTGNRIRYVQTVTGTTPSFTRSLNRLQDSNPGSIIRQMIDRTVNINTLNSTTPNLNSEQGTSNVQLVANVGAITTTAPAFQIQGSDDAGATWYSIGTPLTAVASSTVSLTVTAINAQMLRANVSTAGVGATAGFVLLKAF